jgi:uncharacterized protein (UPF0147 family)
MRTDAFETDLRQALARRAAEVPGTTADRLRHRNYRPRAHSRVIMASAGLVAAAAVSAAVATTALSPASHQPGPPAHARLAAWTVTKLADGNISVTINQFKDPSGLQSTLRADGVPASVTFAEQQNRACQPYPGGTPGPTITFWRSFAIDCSSDAISASSRLSFP